MVQRGTWKGRTSAWYTAHGTDPDAESPAGSEEDQATGSSLYDDAVNLPAHQTKHLSELIYRFPSIDSSFRIVQRDDTNSTGSSLWLSSQVLSSYLLHIYAKPRPSTKAERPLRSVLELGAGTGLLSLLMARLGWQAIATDIPPVLDLVLRPNIEAGLYQFTNQATAKPDQIHVCQLDWTTPPENWMQLLPASSPDTWSHAPTASTASKVTCTPYFDLILTADTIYEPALVQPLLSTLSHLYHRQTDAKPTILLALERRDPAHVTQALRTANDEFALPFKQVPPKRVRKIFDALGDGASWSRTDWDGVEIWKL